MTGSSVLPVAIHHGKLMFLFGLENSLEKSAPGWADFGGSMEKGETPLDAAIREGHEESSGFFADLPTRLMVDGHLLFGDPEKYNIHVFLHEYDPQMCIHFNNMHQLMWQKMGPKILGPTCLFEKCQMEWFSVADIKTRITEFRPFYRKILQQFILNDSSLRKIRRFCTKK